ncbi:hypothetical protein [Sphaerisporangium aureirubrum]|uniref:DUF3024 domain-containing protein n=1 Tax=Sphaerisporangium aureirubrum TaxID=1544736 RepID=A0ABW1NFA3_9ACTN
MSGVVTAPCSAVGRAAMRLSQEVDRLGAYADFCEGDRVALLSFEVGLSVWCEYGPDGGMRFRWWTGEVDANDRYVYTWCPASMAPTAARSVFGRWAELKLRGEAGRSDG